jgi:hypothetical protein
MYICMYVHDIKYVDFSNYKIIKNWMNEKQIYNYNVILSGWTIICT